MRDTSYQDLSPEVLRAEADRRDAAAQESFERSDTDGFLSQWAGNITARLYRAQADITEAGGRAEFPALFDRHGALVAAKRMDSRYGFVWGILGSDDPKSVIVDWFHPSKARHAAKRQATDLAKGYQVGRVRARAVAEIMGSGKGLSGAASAYVGHRRTDGGFSRDVEIVSTSYYRCSQCGCGTVEEDS